MPRRAVLLSSAPYCHVPFVTVASAPTEPMVQPPGCWLGAPLVWRWRWSWVMRLSYHLGPRPWATRGSCRSVTGGVAAGTGEHGGPGGRRAMREAAGASSVRRVFVEGVGVARPPPPPASVRRDSPPAPEQGPGTLLGGPHACRVPCGGGRRASPRARPLTCARLCSEAAAPAGQRPPRPPRRPLPAAAQPHLAGPAAQQGHGAASRDRLPPVSRLPVGPA